MSEHGWARRWVRRFRCNKLDDLRTAFFPAPGPALAAAAGLLMFDSFACCLAIAVQPIRESVSIFPKGARAFFALVCALALFCLEDRGLGNSKKGNIFQRSPFYFYFHSLMTGNNEISRQVYRESPRHIANDCGLGIIVYLSIIVEYVRLQHLWLYFGIFIIHFDP